MRLSQEKRSRRIKESQCQTLCWDCKNATDINACPWARDSTPVDGWWARKQQIMYTYSDPDTGETKRRPFDTYCVFMCPLFERDGYRAGVTSPSGKRKKTKLTAEPLDLRRLSAAIIRQAVNDWKKLDYGDLAKFITSEGSTIKRHQLVAWFNSPEFAVMLSAVSELTPEQVRKELKIP